MAKATYIYRYVNTQKSLLNPVHPGRKACYAFVHANGHYCSLIWKLLRFIAYLLRGVFMLALVLNLFTSLFGLLISVLGLFYLLKPDSDWVRWINNIPEDEIYYNEDLLRFGVIGFIALAVGAAIFFRSIMNIFV